MKYAPSTVGGFLHHISTADGRALVNHFLGRYEEHTLPLLTRLRTSVIHNDANDNNVLAGGASPAGSSKFLTRS
jgi:Ser/Thr protein kinase RdoA (MazF antagonist)